MKDDPFNRLFVKSAHLEDEQRAELAALVLPFVAIDEDNGTVHFRVEADKLNTKQRILVFLLARLALAARSSGLYSSETSPKEIEVATGLPGGTVRPQLAKLAQDHIIAKGKKGYTAVGTALGRARKEMMRLP